MVSVASGEASFFKEFLIPKARTRIETIATTDRNINKMVEISMTLINKFLR